MGFQAESSSLGHNSRTLELYLNPEGQNVYNQSRCAHTLKYTEK